MTLIRVQYDAYNRQFKLLDKPMSGVLEDGETYLIMNFSGSDFELEPGEVTEINLPLA
jgi:hypothetical protein